MTGKPCPLPVIEAKKALGNAKPGDAIALIVDNDIARQNLRKMAEGMGHGFRHELCPDGRILAIIEAREARRGPESGGSGFVVAIGRDVMGGGNDELGGMLMKSFIYSLAEFEAPPARLLFFNSGVRLTTEGSNALADLDTLIGRGTIVESCGACLNFYALAGKLRAGGVTNMHSILEVMARAERLINL